MGDCRDYPILRISTKNWSISASRLSEPRDGSGCGGENFRRSLTRFAGSLVDAVDIGGDFASCCALLFDRTRNRRGDFVDLVDGLGNDVDGSDHRLGGVLDARDLGGDFLGRLGRLVGQVFHFGGHNSEALTCVTRPCRLDCGVQGQQVGLAGDVVNQINNFANLLGGFRQALDLFIGALRLTDRFWEMVVEGATCPEISSMDLES